MNIDLDNQQSVKNCVICFKPATGWTRYVAKITNDYAVGVSAGYCKDHRKEFDLLPHRDDITEQRYCIGFWRPEYGIEDDRP